MSSPDVTPGLALQGAPRSSPPDELVWWSAWTIMLLLSAGILLVSHPAEWPTLALEGFSFLLTSLWLALAVRRPFRIRVHWLLAPIFLIAVWGEAQIAAGWTVDRHATMRVALTWAAHAALFWLALQTFRGSRLRSAAKTAMIVFGFAVSVVASVQLFSSGGRIFWVFETPYDDFVMGPFLNRDHYAAFIELVLPLALWRALRSVKHGPAYALMGAAMFASVVAGASRAGFALVTLEIVYVLLAAKSRIGEGAGRTRWRIALILAGASVLFVGVVGWEVLWNRFKDPDPYRYRAEMLAAGVQMVEARPWTGFGLGTSATVYPRFALFDSGHSVPHLHNDWIECAADGGLPLLAALLIVLAAALKAAWLAPWSAGAAAALLHGLVDFPLQKPALVGWVLVLIAMAITRKPAQKPRTKAEPPAV